MRAFSAILIALWFCYFESLIRRGCVSIVISRRSREILFCMQREIQGSSLRSDDKNSQSLSRRKKMGINYFFFDLYSSIAFFKSSYSSHFPNLGHALFKAASCLSALAG